jgi:hypothetical protein
MDKIGDRAEPLGGKWRPSVGKVGMWFVESRHLQDCSLCLCQLKTDGLTSTSKYWTYRSHAGVYGPSKPSSLSSTDAWLCPHYFNGWLGREIGYEPVDRSAGVLWVVLGALFLGSSDPTQFCCRLCERLLYVDHMRYVWSRPYVNWAGKRVTCWSGFLLNGVHRFESSRLSDMSNRLFVPVIT